MSLIQRQSVRVCLQATANVELIHLTSQVYQWTCRFALQCVSEVAQRALAAEPPSYATIMELDRKVREFPVPPEVTAIVEGIGAPPGDEEPVPLSTDMGRYVLSNCREVGE